MIYRFICLNENNNKIAYSSSSKKGIKLNVPDSITLPAESFCDVLDNLTDRKWSSNNVYVLVEDDCDYGIDWDGIDPMWLSDPKNWDEFTDYLNLTKCELRDFEHLIFDNNAEIVDGSWVLRPEYSLEYYNRIMSYLWRQGKRIRRFEDIISKDDNFSDQYLKNINVNWNDWEMDEIKRSPVWIYEYCKKNGFNEELYNAMSMYSFTNADSIYVKKFMNTKRFVPKNVRKNISKKKDFVLNLIKQNGWTHMGSRFIKRECLDRGMDIGLGYITQCRKKVASGEW